MERAIELRKEIDQEIQVEKQQSYIDKIIEEAKNRPDTKESKYIHDDVKDIDTYEYNENVKPRIDLETRQHFWTVNKH